MSKRERDTSDMCISHLEPALKRAATAKLKYIRIDNGSISDDQLDAIECCIALSELIKDVKNGKLNNVDYCKTIANGVPWHPTK